MLRLFSLVNDGSYAATVESQTTRTARIAVRRPDFYDRNGRLLTGTASGALALALPGDAASYAVLDYIEAGYETYFHKSMKGASPFTVPLAAALPAYVPVESVAVYRRYGAAPPASHLIGYLDYENKGVAGLERAFETYLRENTVVEFLQVRVNALAEAVEGDGVRIISEGESDGGVVLTLDSTLQSAAERIADESFARGAIVVADCATGELLALVSRPNFSPDDVAAAIEKNDTALIDRTLTAYNVGSVYKPVIACAALDAGLGADFTYECTGTIEVGGVTYGCNNRTAHGVQTLESALAHSCNTYFIALGRAVGGEAIYNTARGLGLGRELPLCAGLSAAKGSLPARDELCGSDAELCNHCFGQGKLLLTPAHVAGYTMCIANGGVYRELSVVKSVGGVPAAAARTRRAVGTASANAVAASMRLAMEQGTGMLGAPSSVSAAGKTGTAQTGAYNADGSEVVIGWFSGWFPAEAPRYVVTVMIENEGYGYESAAPVFARIANAVTACEAQKTA